MDTLSIFFIFVFGTIIGSFINVVSLRYNTGLRISRGRSKCFSCSKELRWYELVPIFSYLFQKGRCRSCSSKISLQYPIVEFVTGIVFVLIAIRQYSLWGIYGGFENGLMYSILFFVYYCVVFSILIVISLYDIKHKIIPNSFVYAFIILSLAKLLLFFFCKHNLNAGISTLDMLDLFSPLILFTPFALLWVVSDGRWIGFGDAKLAFGIGSLLGLVLGLSAIIMSFWIGAVYGVIAIFVGRFSINPKRKINMSSEVPFAPFMIIATAIAFFLKIDVLNLSSFLNLLN